MAPPGKAYDFAKRAIDIAAASSGLVLLSPLLLVLSLAVRLDSAGPAIFRHQRVGKGGRPFGLLKFRSMKSKSSGTAVTVAGDSRITRFGRIIRKTKLDELPQLWNVLVGDMSLVGPRPEVEPYVSLFAEEYREILEVRPGITCLAAIEYRHEEEMLAASEDPEREYRTVVLPAKIALHRKSLSERSLRNDMSILMRTLFAVLR